jgi:hypothetical protein
VTKLSGRVGELLAEAFRLSTLLIFVAMVATGSLHATEVATKRALVWSTSVLVEETPNHWVERFTLWTAAPDASRPRPLGEGRGPRLSPDGRWIAFEREASVHVVSSAGGRSVLVVPKTRLVRWSPTSRYLAIVGDAVRGLWVVDVRTRRRITIDDDASIYGASFSPSGTEIVWGRGPKDRRGSLIDGDVDLFPLGSTAPGRLASRGEEEVAIQSGVREASRSAESGAAGTSTFRSSSSGCWNHDEARFEG